MPIKYGSDHRLAREILQQVTNEVVGDYVAFAATAWKELVQRYLIEDASVEPMITLVANDNWMEFTVRYVVDYKKRRRTKDEIFTALLDAIEHSQGRVVLASATFELAGAPLLDVRLKESS